LIFQNRCTAAEHNGEQRYATLTLAYCTPRSLSHQHFWYDRREWALSLGTSLTSSDLHTKYLLN